MSTQSSEGQLREPDIHGPAAVIPIEDARLSREGGLDKTLADTFPCSDALSSIPDPRLPGA